MVFNVLFVCSLVPRSCSPKLRLGFHGNQAQDNVEGNFFIFFELLRKSVRGEPL